MAKAKARKVLINKNPDSVVFAAAPFYNLANIRKDALSLIVRASNDPQKVAAIVETLDALQEFTKVRADHAKAVRAADIKAAEEARERQEKAAAEWRELDAQSLLKDGEAKVERAKGILASLRGEKSDKASK